MATRLQFEQTLVGTDGASGRCGGYLALVGYAVGVPADGAPLAALSDAIARGLMAVGVTPTDPMNPTDADVAALANPPPTWDGRPGYAPPGLQRRDAAENLMRAIGHAEIALLDVAVAVLAAKPTTDDYPDHQKQRDARELGAHRNRLAGEVTVPRPWRPTRLVR